jgi:hypothetical protein
MYAGKRRLESRPPSASDGPRGFLVRTLHRARLDEDARQRRQAEINWLALFGQSVRQIAEFYPGLERSQAAELSKAARARRKELLQPLERMLAWPDHQTQEMREAIVEAGEVILREALDGLEGKGWTRDWLAPPELLMLAGKMISAGRMPPLVLPPLPEADVPRARALIQRIDGGDIGASRQLRALYGWLEPHERIACK